MFLACKYKMRGSGPAYSTPKVPLPGVLTKEQRDEMRKAALERRAERFGERDLPPRDDPDAVVAAQADKDAKRTALNEARSGMGRKKRTKRVKRSKRKTYRR
jgi:hypothetical protein